MTAPQPSANALPITLALVPGGPEAMTKGLGNFKPSTIMLRSAMVNLYRAEDDALVTRQASIGVCPNKPLKWSLGAEAFEPPAAECQQPASRNDNAGFPCEITSY